MTISAKKNALATGRHATQPSSAKLGRSTSITPISASGVSSHTAGRTFSLSSGPLSSATKIGETKASAIASASCMTKMAEKKHRVAPARQNPRATCSQPRLGRKADGPSLRHSSSESPIAPIVKRSAATASGDHSPAMVLTMASPTESELKPATASRMPLRSSCCMAGR